MRKLSVKHKHHDTSTMYLFDNITGPLTDPYGIRDNKFEPDDSDEESRCHSSHNSSTCYERNEINTMEFDEVNRSGKFPMEMFARKNRLAMFRLVVAVCIGMFTCIGTLIISLLFIPLWSYLKYPETGMCRIYSYHKIDTNKILLTAYIGDKQFSYLVSSLFKQTIDNYISYIGKSIQCYHGTESFILNRFSLDVIDIVISVSLSLSCMAVVMFVFLRYVKCDKK